MHPIEAAKQRQNKWWLDFFMPGSFRQGTRDERYKVGIFIVAMLGALCFSFPVVLQCFFLSIPIHGKIAAGMVSLLSLVALLVLRKTGNYRYTALLYGLTITPMTIILVQSLQTIAVGFFYWLPWLTVFTSFLAGRRSGLLVCGLALSQTMYMLHMNSAYGHTLGAFVDFQTFYVNIFEHQIFSMLAITLLMYNFSRFNDHMEAELERQHVARAQTAHKATIGEMLGNLAHEVNNPLAIVQTALIHYQRLQSTQRLEKSMQRGLIQRIEDALDRLNLVVRDLNSSADWSELELPRSFASLQSLDDRPHQFGSTRMGTALHESERPERRRPHFFNRLVRRAVNLLDALLPKKIRTWTTSQKFHARSTALICVIGLVAVTCNVLLLHSEKANGIMFFVGYFFLGLGLVAVAVLKFISKPQLLGLGYILILFYSTVSFAIREGHSVLVPALLWFPIFVMALFLVSRPKTAMILSLILTTSAVLLMLHLFGFGFRLPFHQTFPQFVVRIQSTVLVSNMAVMLLILAFLALMKSTKSLLILEKDWQILSARMRELSELADSAAILIGESLVRLDEQLRILRMDGSHVDSLQIMMGQVERITRISRSFALLSGPKLGEDIQTIEGRLWLQHLHHIIFRRTEEAGWVLKTSLSPPDLTLSGPIGRLTMLAITALKEALAQTPLLPRSALEFNIRSIGEEVLMTISFTPQQRGDSPEQRKSDMEEVMRESLLQELLELLHVGFHRFTGTDAIILEFHLIPRLWLTQN